MDVTACNQIVARGVTGNLVSDLDCSLPYGSYAVVLAQGARLELNGFTLSSDADGVKCEGTCRISGPGTIPRTAATAACFRIPSALGVLSRPALQTRPAGLAQAGFPPISQRSPNLKGPSRRACGAFSWMLATKSSYPVSRSPKMTSRIGGAVTRVHRKR